MRGAAVEGADALGLAHGECGLEERGIVEVLGVGIAALAVEHLSHVVRAVELVPRLQRADGQLLDVVHGQVHILPVLSVLRMAVQLHLVCLIVVASWVVHHHDEGAVELLAVHHLLIERHGCELARLAHLLALGIAEGIGEMLGRCADDELQHVVDLAEHACLGLLQCGRLLAFLHHLAQLQSVFAQLRGDELPCLRRIV